jgi:Ca2+-binding RTX toxin-like protein
MARPTIKRWFEDNDLLDDVLCDIGSIGGPSLPPPGSGGVPPSFLVRLFTAKPDNVDFNTFKAGHYDPATYYAALEGSDNVVLPLSQAAADRIGYDPARTFHGGPGNDTVTGGALNDLIGGSHGNDRLYGDAGDDLLTGGEGHDWLIAGKGNDALFAGNGIDYIDAGAGDDFIVANDDDRFLYPGEWVRTPLGDKSYTDHIEGGLGNDRIFATSLDQVHGGDGNDRIELSVPTVFPGYAPVAGENGDDTIIGSENADFLFTGAEETYWAPSDWNAGNKSTYGGFADSLDGGDGNDYITTMIYCNAIVDTGRGDDYIEVFGLRDLVSMGDDADVLRLMGGACKADLGDGEDTFVMDRSAYDNPNVSEITLGAGSDDVIFNVNWWLSEDNHQTLSEAPWILDFDHRLDRIVEIDVINDDDIRLTLDPRNIFAVNITGGSALIYDDPDDGSRNFTFARFAGVSADQLESNLDTHVDYYPELP